MKRIVTIGLTLVLVLGLGATALAAPGKSAKVKDVPVSITPEAISLVAGDDAITLTAVTLKNGSDYAVTWDGAKEEETILREDGYYESTAVFEPNTVGTHTVKYTINMTAGKSGVAFVGTNTVTITVFEPASEPIILGYEIAEWTKGTQIYNSNGTQVVGYNATGNLWAVYDNNNKVLVDNNFNFELTQKNDNLKSPITYNNLPVTLIK